MHSLVQESLPELRYAHENRQNPACGEPKWAEFCSSPLNKAPLNDPQFRPRPGAIICRTQVTLRAPLSADKVEFMKIIPNKTENEIPFITVTEKI